MSDEKSELGEIGDQPDVELSVSEEVDLQPELELLVASGASQCSEDPAEMTEAVYLGRLEPDATMLFKAHLATCPRCLQAYEETAAFVDAFRAAARSLEPVDGSKVN